jgi:hypothetical protein
MFRHDDDRADALPGYVCRLIDDYQTTIGAGAAHITWDGKVLVVDAVVEAERNGRTGRWVLELNGEPLASFTMDPVTMCVGDTFRFDGATMRTPA